MTTYYVNCNAADDTQDGTTWGKAKKTLNGAENIPVAGDDIVYVAPGVYREQLTVDVSGTAGHTITYIGDVDGSHTDGVGGVVRITGSADDQAVGAVYGIYGTGKNYRTFQGFTLDGCDASHDLIYILGGSTNWTIQDCFFQPNAYNSIRIAGASQAGHTIQRCIFGGSYSGYSIYFIHSATVDNCGHLVSNCLFLGGIYGINSSRIGGITVKNSTFSGVRYGVAITTAITVGQTIAVNNCIYYGLYHALEGTVAGEIVENYNAFSGNVVDRTNTNTGANSNTYMPIFQPPMLLDGFIYPQKLGQLSQWSALRAIAGTGEATDDLYGVTRPATAAKNSWGAVQYSGHTRSAAQKQAGSYSLDFPDAGAVQFFVPTTNTSTTFSVYSNHDADYAGTLPQMIIKQPGQSDTTVTATGGADDDDFSEAGNLLSSTLTPAANPGYVVVELRSNNTAAASATTHAYFDTLTVT